MMRVALIGAALAGAMALPAAAETTDAEAAWDAALRLDIAGRQRMLSQRVAKAACLAMRDVDREGAMAELHGAAELFDRSVRALRAGDDATGLAPQDAPGVIAALDAVDAAWSEARAVVLMGLDAPAADGAALALLDRAALAVLELTEDAVVAIREETPEADALPSDLALTIDVAGRHRMLTQRLMKEVCLLDLAGDRAGRADRLRETIALFDGSLAALRSGMPQAGIVPPPSPELTARLDWVAQLWGALRDDLRTAVEAGPLDGETLAGLARRADLVLTEMDEAVRLYRP